MMAEDPPMLLMIIAQGDDSLKPAIVEELKVWKLELGYISNGK